MPPSTLHFTFCLSPLLAAGNCRSQVRLILTYWELRALSNGLANKTISHPTWITQRHILTSSSPSRPWPSHWTTLILPINKQLGLQISWYIYWTVGHGSCRFFPRIWTWTSLISRDVSSFSSVSSQIFFLTRLTAVRMGNTSSCCESCCESLNPSWSNNLCYFSPGAQVSAIWTTSFGERARGSSRLAAIPWKHVLHQF